MSVDLEAAETLAAGYETVAYADGREAAETIRALVAEVRAYKKAKEENDERFQTERDEAHRQLAEAEAACAAHLAANKDIVRIKNAEIDMLYDALNGGDRLRRELMALRYVAKAAEKYNPTVGGDCREELDAALAAYDALKE